MTDTLIERSPQAPTPAGEIDEPLVCLEVFDVTHDVKSFVLTPTVARSFAFHAGQYVTVRVDGGGQEWERCYSISSPPSRPDLITITVKRVPGGPVSNWLHDHLVPGGTVHVIGPLGEFTRERRPAQKYLFLSAGSGLTPMMSMVRDAHDRAEETDVVLVHNARTPDDILFRSELAAPPTGVTVAAICEDDSATETWTGPRGRLTLPALLAVAPDLHEREILVCGPPPYMAAVRDLLAYAGVRPERCHEESFDLRSSTATRDRATTPRTETRTHTIELRRSGRTIECDAGTTILEATMGAGISVPASCREGVCGTCKSALLTGHVDMQHHGGIRPREIDQGKILLCCSTPCDDLVVDV